MSRKEHKIKLKKLLIVFFALFSNEAFSQASLDDYKQTVTLAWSIASPTLRSFKIDPMIIDIVGSSLPGIMNQDVHGAVKAISNKIYEKTNIKYLNPDFTTTLETSINNLIPLIKSKSYINATAIFAGVSYATYNFIKYNQVSKVNTDKSASSSTALMPDTAKNSIENSEFSAGWYIVEPVSQFAVLQKSIDEKSGSEKTTSLSQGEAVIAFEFSKDTYYCFQSIGSINAVKGKNSLTKATGTGRPCLIREDIIQNGTKVMKGTTMWITAVNDKTSLATLQLDGRKTIDIPLSKIIILSSAYDSFTTNANFKTVKQ